MKTGNCDPWPDPNDVIAHVAWRCEVSAETGQIFVLVLPEPIRSVVLRNVAGRMKAHFLTCEPCRSSRQFLEFLARGLGAKRLPHDTYDLWGIVAQEVSRHPRIVFLDSAEHLTRSNLEVVLDLHKQDDPQTCGVAFVLASSHRRLLQRIDAADSEGSFVSHCWYYRCGCGQL